MSCTEIYAFDKEGNATQYMIPLLWINFLNFQIILISQFVNV